VDDERKALTLWKIGTVLFLSSTCKKFKKDETTI
jgi:hypothetical protein